MKRTLIRSIFLVLLLSALILSACKNKQSSVMRDMTTSGKGSMAIPVKVVKAEKGSISSYIETTTTLEAEKIVDVVSRTSGLVTNLLVEEGTRVKEGQTLLKIDDREAMTQYRSALARFNERKQQWDRAQETLEKKIISREAYDQARANYEAVEADLEMSKLTLDYCTVTAPFDGIVTHRYVYPGSSITTGQKIYTLVDTDPLLAKIYLPERELSKVKKGQTARLELEAFPGKTFEAMIMMINPVVEPESGTFKVTLEISSGKELLRPGMFASVYLITETHSNAILIPKRALLLETAKDSVYVVDGKYAYTKEINVGFADDKNLEVLEGIDVGQYIVVVGQDGLNNGSEVKLFDIEGKEIKTGTDS